MSSTADVPRLERPSFFDGQRLMARDLGAAQGYNRELRWLHNRSLHSWGIAFGFAVAGSRGAQSVKVDTGYAIDCMGRDLISDASIEMPIPAVANASDGGPATYYLTVSYAEDAQLAPITRAGACKTSGAVRRPEMPLIRWQDPNDTDPASRYRFGLDVVLASVHILNCRLVEEASMRERRDAMPLQQPYVAAGRTPVGDTAWRLWPNDNAALGVATTVITSGAGFQITPRYQAQLVGERMFQAAAGGEAFLVDGYAQVAQTTASSFDIRIILAEGTTAGIGRADTLTMDDYRAVVSRITHANPGISAELIIAINGPALAVGQPLFTSIPVVQILGQLVTTDFKRSLEKVSERNGVSLDKLLGANGWDQNLNNVVLVLGQLIAIPGLALTLNPAKVFKPEFMDVLEKDLAWHVVWTGVEG
jgi:hypothetical protein